MPGKRRAAMAGDEDDGREEGRAPHRLSVNFQGEFCRIIDSQVASQPAMLQFPFPLMGVTVNGKLNPSTRLISYKSKDARLNLASVARVSPEASHLRDESQLSVWHDLLSFLLKLQSVRPQIWPDQPTGAVMTMDWVGFNVKPPPLKFSPGVITGQIVTLQSLIIVKTLADSHVHGSIM